MDIHPIKTEADYSAALAEVERLWGAEENTDAGDKLDILITLVDAQGCSTLLDSGKKTVFAERTSL